VKIVCPRINDLRASTFLFLVMYDRTRESAQALWATLPLVYRAQATFHTDHYEAYRGVSPAERHTAIPKPARKTHHIEPFNTTLRQGIARLVRETLSFANKLAHHIGAITYGIGYYPLARATASA
jgi:IS1 family transposase